MATVQKFEDLEIWQRSRKLAHTIFCTTCETPFNKDFSLIDQIRRSSGSVMDNIAEGFDRGGNKEFIQYLYFSKASLSEVKSQVHRATDRSYISNLKFDELSNEIDDLGKSIGALIKYISNSNIKGIKFKKHA